MSAIVHLAHRVRRGKLPDIYFDESHWYAGWYFDLRLEEELARAGRYELPVTLTVMFLGEPPRKHQLDDILTGAAGLRLLRRSDIPGVLGEQEYAILLPHTRADQAAMVTRRMERVFANYAPILGSASFPEDGQDAEHLLIHAEHQALAQAANPMAIMKVIRVRTRSRDPQAS